MGYRPGAGWQGRSAPWSWRAWRRLRRCLLGGGDGAVAASAGSGGVSGWRVFLSHTSELRDFPKGGSFVAAVERAVSACGHVIVDMADFPAADQPAAELCRERVQSCAVYVGVLGTRYGSPVRDMPEVSYTELEFDTATKAGLERLVFVLDTDAAEVGIPLSRLIDLEFGARQEAFRRRVQASGLVTQAFTDPATLGQLVERSLRELADKRRLAGAGVSSARRPWWRGRSRKSRWGSNRGVICSRPWPPRARGCGWCAR